MFKWTTTRREVPAHEQRYEVRIFVADTKPWLERRARGYDIKLTTPPTKSLTSLHRLPPPTVSGYIFRA